MNTLRYLCLTVVQTFLRMFPFPTHTGLIPIGNPGPDAPVLLTGNFRLTVERVTRALKGLDAYLLVANSRGVNVWCASTGGMLTNHEVVSVLKTSGIQNLVNHRRVILPQLAATGIEGGEIKERTGWKVIWGPVEATAIPEFLQAGMEADRAMRTVHFPWFRRLEMAVAWAFPISLLALIALLFWKQAVLPMIGLVWLFSIVLFLSFPLYENLLQSRRQHEGFIFFDFRQARVPFLFWAIFLCVLIGSALLSGTFTWTLAFRWGLISLLLLLLLSMDLAGSTPLYKSSLHADRMLQITLDEERCRGAAFCERVCPVDVFMVDHHQKLANLPHLDQCVQCGACIVQCPFDALFFESPKGAIIPPATIRKYKLNLMGNRAIHISDSNGSSKIPPQKE